MADDGLLGAAEIRSLAARIGLRPAKSWGQNFVVDANTVRRIVRTADLRPDDVVVEVGPGLGSLTLALLPAAARVVAVEIDPRLAAALPETVGAHRPDLAERLMVVSRDALQVRSEELEASAGSSPTAVVANLPYNVAVPVLLHLLESLPLLRRVLVMVQSEVAARLAAGPGSRVYGVPSVKLAWWGSARPAGAVGRTVFWPMPRVDSALVAVDRHSAAVAVAGGWSPDDDSLRRGTFAVVDAAFAQRRKSLRAALTGWAGSATEAERLLRQAAIDPAARGESLDVGDFVRLAAVQGK